MSKYIPHCPKVAKRQPCTPCDELAAINEEISKTKSPLPRLMTKRTEIYGRMNHAHDPITSKLPVEIISKIFANFVSANIAWNYGICIRCSPRLRNIVQTTAILLGSVCTAWRTITWSTPELWTSITVSLTDIQEPHVSFLHEWLRRSSGLPLYIGISAMVGRSLSDGRIIIKALNTFAMYSDKWFYLALKNPWCFLHFLNSTPIQGLMLHTLKILTHGIKKRINLGTMPNLRKFCMDPLQVDKVLNMYWTKLTTAKVRIPTIDMFFDLFSKASSLTHCTIDLHPSRENVRNTRTRTTILRHEHLSYLHIKYCHKPSTIVLSSMEFPALQHLVIDSHADMTNLEIIIDLLRRSYCSLRILEVDLSFKEIEFESYLIPFLAEIPSLQTLEFRFEAQYQSVTRRNSINPLLTWLSATAINPTSQLTFLPSLKDLRIKNMVLSYNHVLDLLKAHSKDPTILATAAESIEGFENFQHVRPLRSLHIQVYGRKYELIDPDIVHGFQRAIKNGFKVTIVAGLVNPGYPPFTNVLDKSLHPSEM